MKTFLRNVTLAVVLVLAGIFLTVMAASLDSARPRSSIFCMHSGSGVPFPATHRENFFLTETIFWPGAIADVVFYAVVLAGMVYYFNRDLRRPRPRKMAAADDQRGP